MSATQAADIRIKNVEFLDIDNEYFNLAITDIDSSAVGIIHGDHEDAAFLNYLYVKTFHLWLNSTLLIGSILAKIFVL